MMQSIKIPLLLSLSAGLLVCNSLAAESVSDQSIGLDKASVFDTPQPSPFLYRDNFPGQKPVLPRSYPGAPPQIPHNIESFLPVTSQQNMCLGCHLLPGQTGAAGPNLPTAIPKSHYTDLRNAPDKVTQELIGARRFCTQCHVPQAQVKVLVENSFKNENK